MDYATATFDEGYRIPRVGSFQVINNLFLRTPIKEWFGLGIGNCDTSAFSFLQSDFYRAYGDYNYRWFTNQWTYLECGIGGFGLYVFFFVTLIITLLAKLKRYPNAIRPYMIASAISQSLCFFDVAQLSNSSGYSLYNLFWNGNWFCSNAV